MITWPDLVIGGIVLVFALKGFKRGFVAEIGGAIALAAAIWAALHYSGQLDSYARDIAHATPGSAHVIGMIAFAAGVYLALLVISAALSRVAKLPVIGIGNALGGGAVGAAKGLVGVWIVLYVLLFFPIPRDLRGDLHKSPAVAVVTQPNEQVDGIVKGTMPWFIRPLAKPLFDAHHT